MSLAAAGTQAAAVVEEHHHIAPMQTHASSTDAATYDQTAVERALRQTVTSLQGLQPMDFLRNFDWGQTSVLPDGRTLREWSVVAEGRDIEVAPRIFYPAWTYNGTVPGPTFRCMEGDRLRIHFRNSLDSEHSMHFHGIHPANMDGVEEVVAKGGGFTYEFDAEPAGLHLYHCHAPPAGLHMARGMYGAFIVDPLRRRLEQANEMVLVASGWDLNFDQQNELYVVNGGANFYRDNPIRISAGELVRLYFVNVLEHDPINSLHLHATFFKAYRTLDADEKGDHTDIVTLCQADRRIIEFAYRYPGRYMFHAHQNKFSERGWMAHFDVAG